MLAVATISVGCGCTDISVTPKKGKALIWPGVHNDDPARIDDRTLHEAQPVIKGTKYAANTWYVVCIAAVKQELYVGGGGCCKQLLHVHMHE